MRFQGMVLFLALTAGCPVNAVALTGSGESAVGVLETVSPTVISAAALSERGVEVTFSETMYSPSARDAAYYSVSGPGKGTLSTHPDTVSGDGPYTLIWNAGEMRGGEALTVTVNGVQDAVGNLVAPWDCNASFTATGEAPVFSNLVVMPPQARAGRKVTILFTASEPIYAAPVVKVNGRNAIRISGGNKTVDFMYEYQVTKADVPGMAGITISAYDPAGNPGLFSNSDALEILDVALGVPLRFWHLAAGLLMVGLLRRLFCRRFASRFFLAAAVLTAFPVSAQSPEVSNVAFVQRPNGTLGTVVDISYDLVAPNGPCTITASLSLDGGSDGYPYPVSSVTGHVSGVTSGTGQHILWSMYADYPEQEMAMARIKVTATECTQVVFQDPGLEQKIRSALGLGDEDSLCGEDMASLTTLDIDARYWDEFGNESVIASLVGLEHAVNLRDFRLSGAGHLQNLSPLAELDQLERLALPGAAGVNDLTPLSALPSLRDLDLQGTVITNWASLSGLTGLRRLRLDETGIADLSPLAGLLNLESLNLGDNGVVDVTPLSSLANLTWLNLAYNPITTLELLVTGSAFSGTGTGDTLIAHGNPFIQAVCDVQIPALESRGVDVAYTPCGEAIAVTACYTPAGEMVDAACSAAPSSDPIVAWHWRITFCLEGWECYSYTNDVGPTLDVSSLCNPEDWAQVELTVETASGCCRQYSGPFCSGK